MTRSEFAASVFVRFRVEVVDDVDLSLLDQLASRLVLRHDAEDDPVEVVAFPAAPVVVVALQDQLLLRLELDDPVGSGPQPFLIELRPGVPKVAIGLVLLDPGNVENERPILAGEVGFEERLRLAAVEHHRALVGCRDLRRILDKAPKGAGRSQPHRQESLEGCPDRLGIDRGAVVEGHTGTDGEGPDALVIVRLPGLGKDRNVLVSRTSLERDETLVGAAQGHGRPVVVDGMRDRDRTGAVHGDSQRSGVGLEAK